MGFNLTNLYGNDLLEWALSIKKVEQEYALRIGQISMKWNELHFYFYICFQGLLDIADETAKELWECAGNDSQQRKMLESVLKLAENQSHIETMKEVIGAANTLGNARNSFIHSLFKINYSSLKMEVVDRATNSKHVSRIREIEKQGKLDAIFADLESLSDFMMLFMPQLLGLSPDTSPKIPTLKYVQAQKKEENK
jgi:hypothetical protein